MPEGIIVKALSGYYYVAPFTGEGDPIQCRARGIFKKQGVSPLVGDRVLYEETENGEGTVDDIFPRTTELIRPPIANVDQAILTFSLMEPELNLPLLDKFLVHTERAGLETVICLTKADLLSAGDDVVVAAYDCGELVAAGTKMPAQGTMTLDDVRTLYETLGYTVIVTSTATDEGVEQVRRCLEGRISVFSGQSGVGKSSLLNATVPGLALDTNAISMKLGRGKHTTRHVELIALEQGGLVADTPGFSQLDFLEMEPEDLTACFPELKSRASGCKFRGCLHHKEPGCQVRESLANGEIAPSRYKHYMGFVQEMKDRKRRY